MIENLKKISSEELLKHLLLLDHGFYETEIREFMQKKAEELSCGINGLACTHGYPMCNSCCKQWWFKEIVLKEKRRSK